MCIWADDIGLFSRVLREEEKGEGEGSNRLSTRGTLDDEGRDSEGPGCWVASA